MTGVTLDEIRCSVTYALANEDIPVPGRFIAKGTVAGVRVSWEGISGGKALLENLQIWAVGTNIDPPWTIEHGYLIDIQGDPNIHNRMLPIPEGDLSHMLLGPHAKALGMRITALPSINAIPAVCAAKAGILTYNDLPAITGRGRLVHYE
jgi:hypothetical protein